MLASVLSAFFILLLTACFHLSYHTWFTTTNQVGKLRSNGGWLFSIGDRIGYFAFGDMWPYFAIFVLTLRRSVGMCVP